LIVLWRIAPSSFESVTHYLTFSDQVVMALLVSGLFSGTTPLPAERRGRE
jgi:hypothetical protein